MATEIDTVLDYSVLSEYDFDQPCEHSQHSVWHVPEDPAKYYIRVSVSCNCVYDYLMCESGYNRICAQPSLNCHVHGNSQLFRVQVLDVLK